MRDIKILFLVLACVGFLYFGVEPYAHTKLHPHVAAADYDFAKEDLNLEKTDVKDAEILLNEAKKSDAKNSTDKTKDAIKNAQKTLDEKKSTAFKKTVESTFFLLSIFTFKTSFLSVSCKRC